MGQISLRGNPDVAITVRRHARARRMSLRVSALDGAVSLTLPHGVRDAEAQKFLADHETWLRDKLADRPVQRVVGWDDTIPIRGEMCRIVQGQGRQVRLDADRLYVPGPADRVGPRLQGWVKALARDTLAETADRYSAALGRDYRRITLRDTRSRWGSCTSDGALMFSWRLVMAPPRVLDYVAAHEVAHLAEMNHGPAFWQTVTRLYGPWQAERDWLHQNGAALHRFQFGN